MWHSGVNILDGLEEVNKVGGQNLMLLTSLLYELYNENFEGLRSRNGSGCAHIGNILEANVANFAGVYF